MLVTLAACNRSASPHALSASTNSHKQPCRWWTWSIYCLQEDLLRCLQLPVLVVLDEAYVDFSTEASRLDWVLRHDNLIVLRTFSKSAGLAGVHRFQP